MQIHTPKNANAVERVVVFTHQTELEGALDHKRLDFRSELTYNVVNVRCLAFNNRVGPRNDDQ